MYIGIDFDGTVVTHEFPKIGKDIGAQNILKKLVANGHELILFTIRSNSQATGNVLDEAVEWFKKNNIPLFGVNEHPGQFEWSTSPKPYCHIYIDDAALGCPLIFDKSIKRPYVDWVKVEQLLIEKGAL